MESNSFQIICGQDFRWKRKGQRSHRYDCPGTLNRVLEPATTHRPALHGHCTVVCICPLTCFPSTGFKLRTWKLALGDLRCHSLESYGLKWLESILCNVPAVPAPTFTHDLLTERRNHLKTGLLSQCLLLVSSPGYQSNAVMIARSHICLHLSLALHVFACSHISTEHLQRAKDGIRHGGRGAHGCTKQTQILPPRAFM